MKEEILQKLRTWFDEMLAKYDWLTFKYEYSDRRHVYLVSYSPIDKIELSDEFNRDAMAFEDRMNYLYGDDAPLFCDEESLFTLSNQAEKRSNDECILEVQVPFSWNFCLDKNEPTPVENNYSLAA
ncbi:MAG: hypothetical protein IKP63_04715 [Paludibacteraceae bacterium]|nr:hypothetical protein [Paludibacteraceae bacterium]